MTDQATENNNKLSKQELKYIIILALVFATRMLGLFMVFPVFSLYATNTYIGVTPSLVGLAIGIYGVTQAILQIPFGFLSDKYGRKKIIFIGLVLFAIGSLVAAFANSIFTVIIGRVLQGAGAIGSSILAGISDVTRDTVRNKAMGVVGLSIGLSFVLAFVIGPIFAGFFGLSGIFFFSFILSILSMFLLHRVSFPTNTKILIKLNKSGLISQVLSAIVNRKSFRFNLSIFVLHANLTLLFLVIPHWLNNYISSKSAVGLFYLLLFFFIGLVTFPILHKADNSKRIKKSHNLAFVTIIFAEIILILFNFNFAVFIIALVLFFIGFNFLESSLPASISKVVSESNKGISLGVYSSLQFLGIFFGGCIGGMINSSFNSSYVVIFAGALALVSLVLCNIVDVKQKSTITA